MSPKIHALKPCAKCAGQDRYSNGQCKACARFAARAWYAHNVDRARAANKEWQRNNPEKKQSIFRGSLTIPVALTHIRVAAASILSNQESTT